jgi:VCBS repeat-containing protein
VQALAEGKHAKDYFTVRVEDQFGAYAEHKVTIDIRGVNDSALITGDISSQVVADSLSAQLTTFGTLFAYDADSSDVGFKPDTFLGQLGSLAIDENGDWTYSVDKDLPVIQLLGEGDSIDDVFTIQSIDGTQQSVTISIFGINDPADISGDVRGDVTEVSNPVATGHLGITDLDYGQASFIAQSAISGQYGVFELNEAGNWKYTLDSNNPDVVHLGVGETLNDLFTVTSFDGLATETINITINGVDDALILQGPSYNLVISSAANEQSNAIDTGSDLFQHFFLVDGEVVTDIEISWFYDQQQVTDYGILYLNSDTGGYKFLADSDVIQNLTTTKLALARIEISNNGEIHPSNIVITLTNAMTSTDVAGVVKLIDLNAGDLIDLSSLSALYDIEDVSFYHDTQQDNNYLAVAHIPVLDVVNITDLQILIDSNSYDLSI